MPKIQFIDISQSSTFSKADLNRACSIIGWFRVMTYHLFSNIAIACCQLSVEMFNDVLIWWRLFEICTEVIINYKLYNWSMSYIKCYVINPGQVLPSQL